MRENEWWRDSSADYFDDGTYFQGLCGHMLAAQITLCGRNALSNAVDQCRNCVRCRISATQQPIHRSDSKEGKRTLIDRDPEVLNSAIEFGSASTQRHIHFWILIRPQRRLWALNGLDQFCGTYIILLEMHRPKTRRREESIPLVEMMCWNVCFDSIWVFGHRVKKLPPKHSQ